MAQKLIFPDFIAKFPPVDMPVTLGEDTHHIFSKENDPLSDALISQFIHPLETYVPDEEMTEYVPCFGIADTEKFIALVWWKAELMNYEYHLATFTLKGDLISHRVIAGTRVKEETVYRSVATINEEYEIAILEGESLDGDKMFDPTSSKTRFMEILVNGEIVDG
ncbi:MAG: hypothetical protein R3A50_00860 [Saprospiraceae bacterium]